MSGNTNGAKSLFGAIPGAATLSGSTSTENQLAWWKILEDAFDYAFRTFPNADLGWVPTFDQAREIRTNAIVPAVKARDMMRDGRNSGVPAVYDVVRIQDMFERWHLYYPFVDQVAVAKAVEFHDSAWDTLTAREHREAVKRLANMRDPYEEGGVIRRTLGQALVHDVQATTPRAVRWLKHPPKERKVLFALVQRYRRTHGV